MIALRMDDPSASLGDFVNAYYLRPFDGRSDVCLKTTTWPPRDKMRNNPKKDAPKDAAINTDGSSAGGYH